MINSQPQSRTVNPGDTATFGVTAGGVQPLRYQWRLNGQKIPGATNSTLVFANAQSTNGGSYSVAVMNNLGAVQSRAAVLLVSTPSLGLSDDLAGAPLFTSAMSAGSGNNENATFEIGEHAHAGKKGGHSVWLKWRAPGNGIVAFRTPGSSFDTLLEAMLASDIANATNIIGNDDGAPGFTSEIRFNATAGTEYLIVVDGRGGAVGNIVLSWNFVAGPRDFPRIFTQPVDATTTLSNQQVFYVGAENGNDGKYQWLSNGVAIPGETALGTVPQATLGTLGVYAVRVTNGTSVAVSDPAVLEISSQNATVTADKFQDALDRAGNYLVGLDPSKKKRPPGIVSLASGAVGSQILNNYGSTADEGEPLHAGIVGGVSRWQAIEPEVDGTLALDTAGSGPDTVLAVYTGDSLLSLQEVASDNNSGPDGRSAALTFPVTAETYYLVAVDCVGGSNGIVQLNWRLGKFPTLSQPPVQVFNPQENITLVVTVSGGVGPFTYQWYKKNQLLPGQTSNQLPLTNLSANDEGLYTLAVSNLVGIVTSTTRLAQRGPIPIFVTDPQNVLRAQGQSISFNASAASTLPVRYQWQLKGKPIAGATNADYTIPQSSGAHSGLYRVIATTSSGSATSVTATATVLIPPGITRSAKPVLVNNSRRAAFTVKASGSAPLSYQWQFNGANIPNARSATHIVENAQSSHVGSYQCVVTNPVGAVTSIPAELFGVAIKKQPRPLTVPAGKRAIFSVKGAGPSPLRYQWWKNGGLISGATNAAYSIAAVSPADEGAYSAQVMSPLATALSTNVQLTVIPQAVGVASFEKSILPKTAQLFVESTRGGGVKIILRGVPGEIYRLEESADLFHWQHLRNLALDSSGEAVVTVSASEGQQFFRVQK
ncbi:MAG TPA: immunoglobulin domain-containing protein [Verrucomicrobiae bacterium]